ncbi:hypothetical protein PPSIR1_37454 [Plesiocystis pacifica SIR-1]|uniref:Outer membrane lipoprotein carrier protein LolA n=1 Tax=Plesiocystis pacifica SIR-1 TaxID=391625 RepID=A6GB16_9BACT|nr:hypothetical protein PPSIR1_37454 [Plesiocystis pacifica SIR-1]
MGLGAAGLFGALAWAAPPVDARTSEQRRLDNRLELWGTFARKTRTNLIARYSSVRTSSLLREDLVGGGTLAFVNPATLVLRDDSATGSTTRIERQGIRIATNDPSLPERSLPPRAEAPAMRWLADHLVACFAPGDGQALLADARAEVPRGRAPRLSLMPPRESPARAIIRSLTLTFDPVGGAVVEIEIAESDGGTFTLALSDHRQNEAPEALARVLD